MSGKQARGVPHVLHGHRVELAVRISVGEIRTAAAAGVGEGFSIGT